MTSIYAHDTIKYYRLVLFSILYLLRNNKCLGTSNKNKICL